MDAGDHDDVDPRTQGDDDGNEEADREAKIAAEGDSTALFDKCTLLSKPIPRSKATVIAVETEQITMRWLEGYQSSPKARFTKLIDGPAVSPSHLQKAYRALSRPEASILTQLRTTHIGLNFSKSAAMHVEACTLRNKGVS